VHYGVHRENSKRTEAELSREQSQGKKKSTTVWNDTIEAYWKYYDERGGIKSLARLVGSCFSLDEKDKREELEQEIRATMDCNIASKIKDEDEYDESTDESDLGDQELDDDPKSEEKGDYEYEEREQNYEENQGDIVFIEKTEDSSEY